ncbi:hypothetical protein CR513_00169, partial [Mucuna pruriens]
EATKIVIGYMDLELAFRIIKLILNAKNLEDKHSNRICVMIMKTLNSRSVLSINVKETTREYMMEMSNLASKLKSVKLESGEDLLVHLVLIPLLAHFGKFKVSYNTQKDKC